MKTETIIVSDIHLGAPVSKAKQLTELLSTIEFNRLILLGDIFHDVRLDRLGADHWAFLARIRDLSNKGKEVVWVRGNHDGSAAESISQIFGVKWCDEYLWEHSDRKYLAVHGDRFVKLSVENALVKKITNPFYLFLQKIDKNNRHVVRLLETLHSKGLMVSTQVARGAAKYAQNLDVDYIFCGHTHKATEKVFFEDEEGKPVYYYNVGCWTRSPSTYATVAKEGEVAMGVFKGMK